MEVAFKQLFAAAEGSIILTIAMLLSRENLKNITGNNFTLPNDPVFELPEKVLQFGTGALLRGLPDYFIDKANRRGLFNGRVVVVKSTAAGNTAPFQQQDGLYTLCVRGIDKGLKVEENIVCAGISRVLSVASDWALVLQCAHNPQLQVIISNTTEIGIALVNEYIRANPPVSYPAKLLAFLLERYNAFTGSKESGMVIVPTELIDNNAKKLKAILVELAVFNRLDKQFIYWLEQHNHFCNSLVDRIVPGADSNIRQDVEKEMGLNDELLIVAEPYRLWAIEGDKEIADTLAFAKADDAVVITEDIALFKELKLRLLNATHTLTCGLAYLAGFDTVKQAMDDERMADFVAGLMLQEIAPSIPNEAALPLAADFGSKVLERFRNPFIKHHWLNITLNYTQKMKVRAVPLLLNFYKKFNRLPRSFSTGFAAYILFMKPVKVNGNQYYGVFNGTDYLINDEKAAWFFDAWKQYEPAALVKKVLQEESFWEQDLTAVNNFEQYVAQQLQGMLSDGISSVL